MHVHFSASWVSWCQWVWRSNHEVPHDSSSVLVSRCCCWRFCCCSPAPLQSLDLLITSTLPPAEPLNCLCFLPPSIFKRFGVFLAAETPQPLTPSRYCWKSSNTFSIFFFLLCMRLQQHQHKLRPHGSYQSNDKNCHPGPREGAVSGLV